MTLKITCWNCGYHYDPFRQGEQCPNCNCDINPDKAERTQFDDNYGNDPDAINPYYDCED